MGIVLALPVGVAVLVFCVGVGACAYAAGLAAVSAMCSVGGVAVKGVAHHTPILKDVLPKGPTPEELQVQERQALLEADIQAEIEVALIEAERMPKTPQEAQERMTKAQEAVANLQVELDSALTSAKQCGIGWPAVSQLREDVAVAEDQLAEAKKDIDRVFQFTNGYLLDVGTQEAMQNGSSANVAASGHSWTAPHAHHDLEGTALHGNSNWPNLGSVRNSSSWSEAAIMATVSGPRVFATLRVPPHIKLLLERPRLKGSLFAVRTPVMSRRGLSLLKRIPLC